MLFFDQTYHASFFFFFESEKTLWDPKEFTHGGATSPDSPDHLVFPKIEISLKK